MFLKRGPLETLILAADSARLRLARRNVKLRLSEERLPQVSSAAAVLFGVEGRVRGSAWSAFLVERHFRLLVVHP